jgi:hypothetical protein
VVDTSHFRRVRLIRDVDRPLGSGPWNGQYALQKALRARPVEWLRIGGALQGGEIPWFWCWQDRAAAALCAATERPFIAGPNILFENSRRPCHIRAEREICDASSCRLLFTESTWYRDLIERYRGKANRAPIVLWPYPIDPRPDGPLAAKYDLLIYAKSGYGNATIRQLTRRFSRSRLIVYGCYRREELYEAARRSRCCLYLSTDDRGPLALAEILLSGCPAVGLPRGAPFIENGATGAIVDRFELETCLEAIARCLDLDRRAVAARAAEQFDASGIVNTILASLRAVL